MSIVFYVSSAVAVITAILAISRLNAVHALLHLVLSLLAVALVFYTLGAPFVAALEAIVYAGAIMVLFIFVAMLLNLGEQSLAQERQWLTPGMWAVPAFLASVLVAEVLYVIVAAPAAGGDGGSISPQQIGIALLGPYLLGVELASFLLMAGIVGAHHLGRRAHVSEESA